MKHPNLVTTDRLPTPEIQAGFDDAVVAHGRGDKANSAHSGPQEAAEGLDGLDQRHGALGVNSAQGAPTGQDEGVDAEAIADAPPAGRHVVRLLRVTVVHRSGDRGYELLLQSGAHLWRPRPLWFRADRVPPAVVRRDLDNVLVPLLRPVAAPGAFTEVEAAEAMIGLAFVATVDASGAVTKAETPT